MNQKKYKELEGLVRQLILPTDSGLELSQTMCENQLWTNSQTYRDTIFARQKLVEIKALLQEEPEITTVYKDQKMFK